MENKRCSGLRQGRRTIWEGGEVFWVTKVYLSIGLPSYSRQYSKILAVTTDTCSAHWHSCQTILRGNAEEKRGKKGALSRKKKGQKRGKKKGQIVFLDGQFIFFLFHISIYILKYKQKLPLF